MKEMYRVLKTGGKAILQVPISMNTVETHEDLSIIAPEEREKYYGQFDHVRLYGQDYSNRLTSVGFNVNKINISQKYEKFGLVENEDLYVVSK